MADPADEIAQLLKADGAKLIRARKHLVWRLGTGALFVQGATPSPSAMMNELANLRRVMGIQTFEHREGERREHRRKHRKELHQGEIASGVVVKGFYEKLSGALEPDFEQKLIQEAHDYVDAQREAKGIQPYFRKPRGYKVFGASHSKSGPVKSYPKEVIAEANQRLRMYGESSMQDYLRRWREGHLAVTLSGITDQPKREEQGNDMATIKDLIKEVDTKVARLHQLIQDLKNAEDRLKRLEDAKAGLEMAAEAIEKAHPALLEADFAISALTQGAEILHALEGKTAVPVPRPVNRNGRKVMPKGTVWPAIKKIIADHGPLTVKKLHERLTQVPGFERYSLVAIYPNLTQHRTELQKLATGEWQMRGV